MEFDGEVLETDVKKICITSSVQEEFVRLISENKDMLYKIAYMYVKNEADSLEILNESIFRAYKSLKKLRNQEIFSTWITRILINCANDHLKKKKRLVFFEDIISTSTLKELSCEEKDREQSMDLFDAVDRLEGLCKTIIILKYFEDYTIDKIADILQCSTSKVKNNLHKALCQLRTDLKEGSYSEKK